MVRIGITGHSNLTADTELLVRESLLSLLGAVPDGPGLIGISCLARGADQVFARVVLELGGSLEVVLPAPDYRQAKVKPDNMADFDELLGQASSVRTMPFARSGRAAYMAASEHVLDTADTVVAVWDGEPAGGHGGTADVVQAARDRELPVRIIWPDGAQRT